ncbi:MAG: polysaccharide biosynthesis tyrosine autokinase [Alphaproteobacteria bacterium]|nr:polysaccharide biosynthesis tyrosine autokinase [Alphaproteobacteria bacterium]
MSMIYHDNAVRGHLDLAAVTPMPMPSGPPAGGAGLGELLFAFRRHWVLAIVATLVLGALATAIALAIPNRYQAWSAVLVEAHVNQVLNIDNAAPDVAADDLAVDSEAQVLRSQELASQVVDRLNLMRDPEFTTGLLGGLFGGGAAVNRTVVIDRFLRNLAVDRRNRSRVLQVYFTALDPTRAATIVNTLLSLYLDDQVQRKVQATREANVLLDKRLAQLRADVDAKEQAVQDWQIKSGLVSGATAPAINEQITQADAALGTARDELAQAHARRVAETGDASNAVVNNVLIQHLRERETDIQRRIAELSADIGPRHPTMINLQAELAKVRASIASEIGKINADFAQQERVAAARVAELEQTVRRLRSQSGQSSDAQVRLHALEREAAASRTVLDTFLRRYNETSEQVGLQRPDARILGKAEPPTGPVFPSRAALLGFGWLLALGIGGIGAPALREALAKRGSPLVRIEVIERVAGPALAVVPALTEDSARRIYPHNRPIDEPRGDFAEAVRSARASLLFARADRRCKIVLLTSATTGEGKTVLAAAIARSAALAGEDTLLVDVNLRKPGVHQTLELSNELGVFDYLERGLDVEALIQIDPRSPLEVMTAGQASPSTPPLLTLAALTRLFDELRARYRLVILDGPALLSGAESRFLASAVDEVVLVARGDLSAQALSFALRQLNEAHVASLRVLINRVDLSALQQEAAAAA